MCRLNVARGSGVSERLTNLTTAKELPDGVDDPDKATLVAAVTRPPIIISKPSSAGATDLVCSATATIASVLGVMVFSLL